MNQAELTEKLVRCIRMMDMIGLVEHNGHVSARIPGTDRVLIQSRFSSRATLTSKDIVTVDLKGRLLEGDDEPPSETPIHTCIYQAREDVSTVAHLHCHYAVLLSMSGVSFMPVCNDGVLFVKDGVPLFPHSWNIGSESRGKALAGTLGGARGALMKGHGAVVVSEVLEGLFQTAYQLEQNARYQVELMMLGKLQAFSGEDIRTAPKKTLGAMGAKKTWKVWNYFASVAERKGVFD